MERVENNLPTNSSENDLSEIVIMDRLDIIRMNIEGENGEIGRTHTSYTHGDDTNNDDSDKFTSTVKSFFESSTLHGFHYLIDTAIWVRVLWILALTAALMTLSMQVIGLTKDYLAFNVTTEVSIHQDKKIFPSLTVCNNRRFLSSKVAKLPLFARYQNDNMDHLRWQTILHEEYHNLKPTDFEDLGAEVSGTIAVYPWAEIEPVPFHGSCYFVKPSPDTKQLTINFNLHVNESISYPDRKAGFTVYFIDHLFDIHHPLRDPVYEIGVPLGLVVVNEISYDVLERLNGSYGQCQDGEHLFKERTGLSYTPKLCMSECLFKTILSKCRCIHYEYENFPFWVKTNVTGYEPCRKNAQFICIEGIETTPDICDCKPECHMLIYGDVSKVVNELDYFNSFQENSSQLYELKLWNETKEWSKNNTALLTIILSSRPYKTFKQQPRYPFLRFISDIGGTMGLYLGASILTTFEFVQMAISGILHAAKIIWNRHANRDILGIP